MNKWIFLLIMFPSLLIACSGPQYTYPSVPGLDLEMNNIYHYLCESSITNQYSVVTLSQLQSTIPNTVGIPFYCKDCTVSTVCVSTGTTIFGFSDISAKSNACH